MPNIVGLDEVGRGALAGPLTVGAVWLPTPLDAEEVAAACRLPELRDSKKLTRLQRERLSAHLESRVGWAVGSATPAEIDALGLTAATSLAAGRALEGLSVTAERILADAGLRHPLDVPTEHFVKGDERILEIMLASTMAKVWRDARMRELAGRYPEYGFATNVGYGSAAHYGALRSLGSTDQHRQLFLRGL